MAQLRYNKFRAGHVRYLREPRFHLIQPQTANRFSEPPTLLAADWTPREQIQVLVPLLGVRDGQEAEDLLL